jgi:hypothetical protein
VEVVRPETKTHCAPSTTPEVSSPSRALAPTEKPLKRSAAPKGTNSMMLAIEPIKSPVSGSNTSAISLNGLSRTSLPLSTGSNVTTAMATTDATSGAFERAATERRRLTGRIVLTSRR